MKLRKEVQDKAIETIEQAMKRRLVVFEPEEFEAIRQALIERRDAASREGRQWP